jgi:putative spermidine/putrescine transport system substrate-binding protein
VVSRRKILQLTAAGAATAMAPAVLQGATQTPLRVSAYGGMFENALRNSVAKRFTAETGIAVEIASQGAGDDWLFGIVRAVRSGLTPIDMTMLTPVEVLRSMKMGRVFQPFTETMANVDKIPSEKLFRYQGQLFGVGMVSWYLALVINPDLVKSEPTSWRNIFEDEAYRRKISLNGNYNGGVLEIIANTYFDGTQTLNTSEGLDAVFAKMADISPQVKFWWTAESQMEQALRNGDVIAGTYFHDVANLLKNDGFPIQSTFPKEGAYIGTGQYTMLASTKKTAECHAFVNFCAQPDIQAIFAREMRLSPTLPNDLVGLSETEFNLVGTDIPPIYPAGKLMAGKVSLLQRKWQRTLSG